jgi:hypothetical protein
MNRVAITLHLRCLREHLRRACFAARGVWRSLWQD